MQAIKNFFAKAMKHPVGNVVISLIGICVIFFSLYFVAKGMYPAK